VEGGAGGAGGAAGVGGRAYWLCQAAGWGLYSLYVLTLVLTLVENAVKHGISRLTDGGRVRITAKVAGDRLQVRVANSGSLPGNAAATGVGLSNARERLQLIYGSAASLTLEPEGTSVVASVSTPLQPAMAEAAS
jgi:LytS/YehU family sensor histidine kinase